MLSWRHAGDQPRGRSSLWLHPAIPLRFVFQTAEAPELSREWIEELMRSANSGGGIVIDLNALEPAERPGPKPVEAA